MEKESTHGLMAVSMKVNGVTIKCMEKALLFGLMEENMLVNILTIKNKVMESFSGLMVGVTEVNGRMVNKMGRELTSQVLGKRNMVNGNKEKESDGLDVVILKINEK